FDMNNTTYTKELNEIFLEFMPDIIHTNNLAGFSVSIWEYAKKKKVKTVHTLRDYYLQCPKTTKFNQGKICTKTCTSCKLLSIIKKRKSHSIDFVVGISNYILKDHLNEGFFENATTKVIYNGFNTKLIIKENHFLESQT